METIRHIISGEVNNYFADKLHQFHDDFVETMLLCGVDAPGTALDKIKMTKNPNFSMPYYKKVVGGLLKFPPQIYVTAIDEFGEVLAECFFTHLNDSKLVNSIFLLQNVYHWESSDLFCAQVWQLKPENMCNINRYWYE